MQEVDEDDRLFKNEPDLEEDIECIIVMIQRHTISRDQWCLKEEPESQEQEIQSNILVNQASRED